MILRTSRSTESIIRLKKSRIGITVDDGNNEGHNNSSGCSSDFARYPN